MAVPQLKLGNQALALACLGNHSYQCSRLSRGMQAMRNRTIKLWSLNEYGSKIAAGTIEAAEPREVVMKWSWPRPSAGVCFATYCGSFVSPGAALESDASALAA